MITKYQNTELQFLKDLEPKQLALPFALSYDPQNSLFSFGNIESRIMHFFEEQTKRPLAKDDEYFLENSLFREHTLMQQCSFSIEDLAKRFPAGKNIFASNLMLSIFKAQIEKLPFNQETKEYLVSRLKFEESKTFAPFSFRQIVIAAILTGYIDLESKFGRPQAREFQELLVREFPKIAPSKPYHVKELVDHIRLAKELIEYGPVYLYRLPHKANKTRSHRVKPTPRS